MISGRALPEHIEAYAKADRVTLNLAPRGLSKEAAAAYCGCKSLSALDDWVRRGIVPGAIPGTHRWDRKAIDEALDRASGLQTTIAPSALEQWKANRARRAQGNPHG